MIIDFEDLVNIREKHKNQKIVFASGCFDLTHAGHVLFFEDCKQQGDILVVCVGADEVIKRDKGEKRPILNEHLRMKLVDALRGVDYVFKDRIVEEGAHPLFFFQHVFDVLRPDVYVVNDDAFDIPYREELSRNNGVALVICGRKCPPEFEGISTTKLIKKIKET